MTKELGRLAGIDLLPGKLHLAQSPSILRTILGSCISLTFFSSRLGAGAMCHSIFPRLPKNGPAGFNPWDEHRYVDASIRYLARRFESLGAHRSELQIKVFGGADVLSITRVDGCRPTVGRMNCVAAAEVLAEEGFTIVASDVGGTRGRKIQFDTSTGEVLVQRLNNSLQSALLHRRTTK
jgi:chemotaxis protein CheD